jgi:hypothetical protein
MRHVKGDVLGVLAEPLLCEGQRDITAPGGWRAYTASRARNSPLTRHGAARCTIRNHPRRDLAPIAA